MRGSRLCLIATGLAALVISCGDDPGLPEAEHEVQVRTDSLFPSTLTVTAGERVRWVSILREGADTRRSVTSGSGPADTLAGGLFDAVLEGYGSGDPTGDTFVFRFEEPETTRYFSRFPEGHEFTGVVIVR